MTACLGVVVLGWISLPVDHKKVVDQTTITGRMTLPHVEEVMDQWHFWVDPDGDSKRRTLLTFCPDGLMPPWNEGQEIVWMKIRVEKDCLQLLGYDGLRDKNNNIINQ